ncbi:hypothetical protein D9M71_561070 [compost metagenome]
MVLFAAHFPDPDVLLLPGFANLVDHFHGVLPALVGNRFAVFVDQVNRVHQLAENVELDLGVGQVADAHRRRAAVPGQVREFDFRQFLAAVDAIQDIEFHRFALAIADPSAQPAHVGVGLFGETQAHEGIDGEGRVADPGVAVIPVAFSAEGFR